MKVKIAMTLEGELLEKFNKVKQKLGLVNNPEVIRVLISRASENGVFA